jgi:hypothetical protein
LIVDVRFLKLLAKYPGRDGCIVESGGGDHEIEEASSGAGDVIDLCDEEDEETVSVLIDVNLKREASDDGGEQESKRVKVEQKRAKEGVIVID